MSDAQKSQLGIEESFERLDTILESMEEPGVELERSFKLYEEGMKLLKSLNDQIDQVEKKVLILSEGGQLEEFAGEDSDED